MALAKPPKIVFPKVKCPVCEIEFQSDRTRKKYCSTKHRLVGVKKWFGNYNK